MSAIYIVEGVAGSGKDTLTTQLLAWLRPDERHVQAFPEEAVLASWLHYFVPNIHESRLDLTHRLVEHVERTLEREPDTVFVFNRFHVSHAVWRAEMQASTELEQRHTALVARLSKLPTLVLHTVVEPSDAEARTSHLERREVAWRRFLARRLETHAQTSPGASYLEQQDAMTRIIERDALPYRRINLGAGVPVDIGAIVEDDS